MLSIILKRSSSSLAPKWVLPSYIQTLLHHQLSPATSAADTIVPRNGVKVRPFSVLLTALNNTTTSTTNKNNNNTVRDFHGKSGPLNFKASGVAQAEFAVDDYGYDEEKGKWSSSGREEGLEIAKLGISEEIISSLAGRGITKLFPIQRAVLEPAMQGRDLFGRARTGTGKTLAFGIPIIDRIIQFNAKHGKGRNPLGLVMAPTRELARQVEKEFRESAPSLDTICLYGGTPITRQMRELDYGVDVVVGTPGRIIDLMKRGSLNLSEVQFVVLDEADQMLGVGFVDDIETIFQRLPQNRHSMLFSATMPSWIQNLVRNYLKDPMIIDLVGDSDKKLADGITLYSIASDMYGRASILGPLITEHAKGGKCIVFTETKREADQLAYAMKTKSFRCEALHGDISQSVRERTLSDFRSGNFNILVATDVAARGLDVPNVDLVIHYALPRCSETFVHRSGRTGRAGKKGSAILIYPDDQARQVRIIERDVGCKFSELPRITVEGGGMDMFNSMNSSGRFGSFGGTRDRRPSSAGFGRSGGLGDYGSGHFGGYRNSGFGRSDGRSGQFSGQMNGPGRFGNNRNQPSTFGDFGPGSSSTFGDFGSGRSSGFGDNNASRSSGSPNYSNSNRLGSVWDIGNDDRNTGRRQF